MQNGNTGLLNIQWCFCFDSTTILLWN